MEPGLQQASTTTYPISPSINDLLKSDPNISADKINAIQSGINAAQRQAIESEISKYAADKKDNIETGVEESSLKALESRTEYIGQL